MSPKKRSRASSTASDDVKSHKHSGTLHGLGGSSGAGASSSRAARTLPASGPLVHASQDLDDFQASFWRYQMDLVEQGGDADGNIVDFKSGLPTQGQLPLARIKKVMKSDDQVKMISAEAPILFARACEIFISDLTCRAFLIAEEHKRRTIQRSDIAGAIGRSDLFDFLIDIVPRHESVPSSRLPGGGAAKREKTGEGKGLGHSSALASGSKRQQQLEEPTSHDEHLLHGFSGGAYEDADASAAAVAEAAAAASDSFNIPHTAVDSAHVDVGNTHSNSSMAHWIHDSSADEHSSQPELPSHTHSHSQTHHQSAPHPSHDHHQQQQQHHHAHHAQHPHHGAQHHISGHHSHHHSPLDYVTPSNAGTPNSIGAGSTNGGAWSHTFSGF